MACKCGLVSSEEGEEHVPASHPVGSEERDSPRSPGRPHADVQAEHTSVTGTALPCDRRAPPPCQSTSTVPQQQVHSQGGTPRGRSALSKADRSSRQTQMSDQSEILVDLGPPGVSGTQSDSAIIQQTRNGEKLFYGAHIGSETRNVEFKRGGGAYLRSSFRSHLRRYACAFLNGGGGSLLVGVDDGGIVRGIHCDHRQEDQARLLVDSVLKFFRPPLLPHCYSLAFVPVVRPGPEGVNLKVLRLSLRPPPGPSQLGLYQTDQGEVYLRRDGSVEGPLSAAAIQEWARQKWSGEVMHLEQCVEALLTEQRVLLQELRQQCMLIASLQNSHACSNTHTPAGVRERLLQTLGRLGPHASSSDAGGCQGTHSGPASSGGSAQVGVEWAGSSDISGCSLTGREGLVLASDESREACRGQWRGHGRKEDMAAASSICCII